MELPGKRELREQILHQMDGRTSYVSDKDVYREIDKAILRSSHGGYGTLSEKEELRRQMFYSIRGFDVLEKYLGDSSISEIMVIGASRIFVEQNGKIRRIEEHFSEEGDVYRLIEQIVAPTNRMVNEACPIVDSRLPDGSRVHIVLPPVSLEGPVITIRKFLKGGMTIEKLLAFEEFPEKLTGILSALVKSRYNILISGATNSGKSSLLNALAEYIGKRERVITIEDSAELQLFHVENLVRLETRNANMEGENEITMQDLIKASLRMRPDRIIVGEVRGAEAMSMLQALYELAEDGYIRLDGSINEEEQAKLKRGETYRTYIVVTARYGEYRKSKKYEIRIVPKKNISQTNVFYKIQQYLKKEEQENRYSRDIKIPSVYKDIEITKRQENQGGISGILILFVTVCIFIPLHNYLKLQEEGKKCQEQAERDFPVIVHLLTLYMGAGLSFFSAVKRISQNYQKQRELDDSKKYAFEKMMRMEQQMSNGVSQREACQDWGMQFRTDSYQKLSLILIQSFTKGGREAAMLMEAEEREAFHKQIDRAKKEGEEASTRLLFPMILLLCQVMLLVMYPALTRFQGF